MGKKKVIGIVLLVLGILALVGSIANGSAAQWIHGVTLANVVTILLILGFLQLLQHFIDIMLQLFGLGTVTVILHRSCALMGRQNGSGRTKSLYRIIELLLG